MSHSIMTAAGSNNMCRLHLGFHYPRSGYTIYQSVLGFDRYLHEYGECVEDVPNNLYAVHADGLVTAEAYIAVMDSFSLDYEMVDDYASYFQNPEKIRAVVRVNEKCVNRNKILAKIRSENRARIIYGKRVDHIDSSDGRVFSGGELLGTYDFVINATYSNPNLGLSRDKWFDLKFELCVLVLARTTLPRGVAITIMDGPFVSVYPAYDGLHTVWSVLHSPLLTFASVDDLYDAYDKRLHHVAALKPEVRLIDHARSLIRTEIAQKDLWIAPKTKLATDKGDTRVTEIRVEGKLYSVLCGKLDAVFEAADRILAEMS
jgi:hypothetical protein